MINVDRLKPYFCRTGKPPSPGPVTDPGQSGEHVVEQLLNRKTVSGRTYCPVLWQGHASAADSWEQAEHLRASQTARSRSRSRSLPHPAVSPEGGVNSPV